MYHIFFFKTLSNQPDHSLQLLSKHFKLLTIYISSLVCLGLILIGCFFSQVLNFFKIAYICLWLVRRMLRVIFGLDLPPFPLMPVLKITTYFSFGSDFHYKSTIPAYAVKHGLNYIRVAERRETHVEKMKKIFLHFLTFLKKC